MEKDSSACGLGCILAKLLKGREGIGCSHLPSSSTPEALKGHAFPLRSPREGAQNPRAEWLGRRPEASGQQREPGPRPGRLPAREERGARSCSAPPGPAHGPRRRRPASQLRPQPQPAAAPGVQLLPSRGRRTFCPRPQPLPTRSLRPLPHAPHRAHSAVHFALQRFIVFSRFCLFVSLRSEK